MKNRNLGHYVNLVTENYPLAKQSVLLSDQSRLNIEAINKGKLPKMDVNAQATYQSDVTIEKWRHYVIGIHYRIYEPARGKKQSGLAQNPTAFETDTLSDYEGNLWNYQ